MPVRERKELTQILVLQGSGEKLGQVQDLDRVLFVGVLEHYSFRMRGPIFSKNSLGEIILMPS